MALTTPLDFVRLELGDTDANSFLLSDDELNYFLAQSGGDVLGAAWRACDALARKFARAYDFGTDGQDFKRSQMSKQFAELAKDLRQRSATGGGTATTTRVDGYSQDVTNEDVKQTNINPRRRFYGEEDYLP